MAGYKKDQGRMARLAVFWSIALLIYYGCYSLKEALISRFTHFSAIDLESPLIASFPKIPVISVVINGALLIAVVVFAGAMFVAWRWQEKPKNAELLIETEAEMRKVTWPTRQEVFSSSVVVVCCVLFMMAFLAGADWMINRITGVILFGSGG
jgi:preprotein translocase SecE subunit